MEEKVARMVEVRWPGLLRSVGISTDMRMPVGWSDLSHTLRRYEAGSREGWQEGKAVSKLVFGGTILDPYQTLEGYRAVAPKSWPQALGWSMAVCWWSPSSLAPTASARREGRR